MLIHRTQIRFFLITTLCAPPFYRPSVNIDVYKLKPKVNLTSLQNFFFSTIHEGIVWTPVLQRQGDAHLKLTSHSFSLEISIITKPPTVKRLSKNACSNSSHTAESSGLRGKTCIHQVKHRRTQLDTSSQWSLEP